MLYSYFYRGHIDALFYAVLAMAGAAWYDTYCYRLFPADKEMLMSFGGEYCESILHKGAKVPSRHTEKDF
ncbi:MAG: hypothetical protein PHO15_10255 [Eubacteriales bacterium]|nr:hypothetical protein [Eubacteriales bacterium]